MRFGLQTENIHYIPRQGRNRSTKSRMAESISNCPLLEFEVATFRFQEGLIRKISNFGDSNPS